MKRLFSITLICLIMISYSLSFFAFVQAAVPAECDVSKDSNAIFKSNVKCYEQLAPIKDPGTNTDVSSDDFQSYLQGMYRIGIGACFVLGVIMFTWAGIEYILSESVTKKSDAKGRIAAALTGLAIALVSYILLQTINPHILEFKSLDTTPTQPAG